MGEADALDFCAARMSDEAIARLKRLATDLTAENERQNLVSSASLTSIWSRHFADSAQLLDHVPRGTSPLLDLGTGAGFPGLVLAIARPEVETVLVESRRRRVEWLLDCIGKLGLDRCRVVGAKLESAADFPAATITARAFAPLERLLRLSARFSTPDTVWLLPKGRSAAQELSEQPLGIREMFHVEQSLIDSEAGILVGRGLARQ